MAGLKQRRTILHTIKAWLYPNYLQNVEGQYIARLKADKVLTVEDICSLATTRGGSAIDYNTMVDAVTAFLEEVLYNLADGYSVAFLDLFTLALSIGGTFANALSPLDPRKNKLDIILRKLSGLRDALTHTTVSLQGLAEVEAYIGEVQDVATESVDETLTPGNAFKVLGRHIKIAGDDSTNGLYLVSIDSQAATKITGHLIQNYPAELIALVPQVEPGAYHVRVVTQYSSGASLLKEPRTIEYAALLVVPQI